MILYKNRFEIVFPSYHSLDTFVKSEYKHLPVVAFTINTIKMKKLLETAIAPKKSVPDDIFGNLAMFRGIKVFEVADQKENCKPFYDMQDLEIYLSKYNKR